MVDVRYARPILALQSPGRTGRVQPSEWRSPLADEEEPVVEKKKKKKRKGLPMNSPIGEHLPTMHQLFVPKGIFFTHGVGVHKDYLSSFELALRDANVEKQNLVTVSSIFPPHCREVSRKEAGQY